MNLENLKAEIEEIRASVCAQIQSLTAKLRLKEAWTIVQESAAKVVLSIEKNIGKELAGPEKKAHAMAVIEKVIDTIIIAISVPFLPTLVTKFLSTYFKRFLLEVADGSIDALVSTFHDTGVFEHKPTDTPETKV